MKTDWALEIADLLEGRNADCERVTLMSNNLNTLNTHTRGACYEAFELSRARALVQRLKYCHTLKHGNWLNITESEPNCVIRQCLHHRCIGDIETL